MRKSNDKEELLKNDSDKFNKLANRLKSGDIKSGEEIFNYFSPLIYRFVMARLLNRQLAEDLTQDVFLKVVSKITQFDGEKGNFSAWIWQIARNSLIDYFRDKKEIVFADMPEGMENMFKTEDQAVKNMMVREVIAEIKNFSDEEQEIFTLYYLSDLAYKDMSKITGKSEGSLRVAIHRLNKKLRGILNPPEKQRYDI